MKKLLILGLAVVMILAFTGCGTQEADTADDVTNTTEDVVQEDMVEEDTEEDVVEEDTEEDVIEEDTEEDVIEEDTEEDVTDDSAEGWSVKVGDFDVIEDMAPDTFETVTQILQMVSKDGSLKDQECTGYKVSEILEMAGITDFETLTVVAADDYEYELTAEVALLDTTMLVTIQDGEEYDIPRFAVECGDSAAWVKDVIELRID